MNENGKDRGGTLAQARKKERAPGKMAKKKTKEKSGVRYVRPV